MTGPRPLLPLAPELRQRLTGVPCVIMLDVDGTLAPIAPSPEEAEVPAATRRVVAALAARDGVHLALVSGRAANDARRMVSVSNVWVIGNHGAEVIAPDGEQTVDPQVAQYQGAMARARAKLTAMLKPVVGVLVEDKRWSLSIHYRQADPHVLPRLQAIVEGVARDLGLRVHGGKMVFEIRPPVLVDKGTAVYALAQRLQGLADGASLLFAGDDRTDEDAFRVLRMRAPQAITVRVADDPGLHTIAEYVVPDPTAMRSLLEELLVLLPDGVSQAPR